MKITLVLLALACFIGALHALPLQEETNFDKLGTFIETEPQDLLNVKQDDEALDGSKPNIRKTGPSQIRGNAYKSQGPLSGRLTNVVLNEKGAQKTVQKNRIQFNMNSMRRALDDLLENEDSE